MQFIKAPVRYESLGFGTIGVPTRTAHRMRDIIRKSAANEYVRKFAERQIQYVQNRDEWGEAEAIYRFLQAKTRYAYDPRGVEYIQTPPYVLKHIEINMIPSLDCDDYATLGLSLLRSIGFQTAIRLTGYKDDGRFTHVYGLVKIHGKWTPFDPIRKEKEMGWEAPNRKRSMDIPV